MKSAVSLFKLEISCERSFKQKLWEFNTCNTNKFWVVKNNILDWKRPKALLPFQHVKLGGRGYGEIERADRQHLTLPKPAGIPESLAGRQFLQQTQNRQSEVSVTDSVAIQHPSCRYTSKSNVCCMFSNICYAVTCQRPSHTRNNQTSISHTFL